MKTSILLLCIIGMVLFTQAQTGPMLVAKTSEGGGGSGAGIIFQYTGGDTVVGQVDVITTGNPPNCDFTQAPNGKLYGAVGNGVSPADELIEYDYVANTYTVAANFDTSTGTFPQGRLLLVGNTFYGLAYSGGANASGTIFSYTIGASGATKLADLPAKAYPYGGLIMASDSNLYGVTHRDGANSSGTIFRYNIDSMTYTPLYNMPSYAQSYSTLVEAGKDTLYGLTYNDSIKNTGSIFSYVITSGVYTPLYYFPGASTFSEGSLTLASDGLLYGMTANGGLYETTTYSGGTFFSYNRVTGVVDTLHNFGNGTDGAYPLSDVYQASDGMLYGMTNEGGDADQGTIFQYNIKTGAYKLEVSLNSGTGYFPGYGRLTEYKAAPAAIANVQDDQFNLYPNPGAGIFTINNNYPGIKTIQVLNLLGEKLKEYNMAGTHCQFDISNLAAGIYAVRISDGTGVLKVLKVVKE